MLGKNWKCVLLLLALLVTTVANAAPTMSYCNTDFVARALPTSSDAYASSIPQTSQITERCNSYLAGVAAEFLKPPAAFTDSPTLLPAHAKSLPAVPGALLMVLTGFLCVSLIKDRRVWLSVLAGLLWVGQTGIQAIPQLALRLNRRNHIKQQLYAELVYPCYLENSTRLRSDIEGTQYIGLLRHLAGIPDTTMSFLRKQESRKETTQLCCRFSLPKNTNLFQSQSAFLSEQYSLNSLLNCLLCKAEQFICFSPVFILAQLPRGPPELA